MSRSEALFQSCVHAQQLERFGIEWTAPLQKRLMVVMGGVVYRFDAGKRPSDALALALRLDCPIYVEESVMKNYLGRYKMYCLTSQSLRNAHRLRRFQRDLDAVLTV